MENEEKTNRQVGEDGLSADERRLRAVSSTGQRFVDKYGDIWVRQGDYHIIRISDGNIGGWFDGKGLSPLTQKPNQE